MIIIIIIIVIQDLFVTLSHEKYTFYPFLNFLKRSGMPLCQTVLSNLCSLFLFYP